VVIMVVLLMLARDWVVWSVGECKVIVEEMLPLKLWTEGGD